MNPREINPQKYNVTLAEALKSVDEFQAPEWSLFVKSSAHRERPTSDPDFWYKRSASVLKQFYTKGDVGVSRLRTRFGGKKDRGMKPSEFRKAGGKIIRTILQQAESAGFLKRSGDEKSVRTLSDKGKAFLEEVADKASKVSKEDSQSGEEVK